MNESFVLFIVSIAIGFALGFLVSSFLEYESRKKAWRTLVMGLDDFDIKCINKEYAKRKRMMEQEGKA